MQETQHCYEMRTERSQKCFSGDDYQVDQDPYLRRQEGSNSTATVHSIRSLPMVDKTDYYDSPASRGTGNDRGSLLGVRSLGHGVNERVDEALKNAAETKGI